MSQKRSHALSNVVTGETRFTSKQIKRVRLKENVTQQIENTCTGLLLKRLRGLLGEPKWRDAQRRFDELSNKTALTQEEIEEKQALSVTISELKKRFRITRNHMYEEAAKVNHHFGCVLSSIESQDVATKAFVEFEKAHFWQAN